MKFQPETVHSGARTCVLNVDADDSANSVFRLAGHWKFRLVKMDMIWRKSRPMLITAEFTWCFFR